MNTLQAQNYLHTFALAEHDAARIWKALGQRHMKDPSGDLVNRDFGAPHERSHDSIEYRRLVSLALDRLRFDVRVLVGP